MESTEFLRITQDLELNPNMVEMCLHEAYRRGQKTVQPGKE